MEEFGAGAYVSSGPIPQNKVYDLTKGTKGTKVLYFAIHHSEEESDANHVRIHLKPALRLRNVVIDFDWKEQGIKGRGSKGNIVTRQTVSRITKRK